MPRSTGWTPRGFQLLRDSMLAALPGGDGLGAPDAMPSVAHDHHAPYPDLEGTMDTKYDRSFRSALTSALALGGLVLAACGGPLPEEDAVGRTQHALTEDRCPNPM